MKKGIFPWNKAKKDDSLTAGVYAGPEYFNNGKEDDNTVMNEVYAGPEFFEKNGEEEVINILYAAPGYFGKNEEFIPPPATGAVYAGPEFYNPPADKNAGCAPAQTAQENVNAPIQPEPQNSGNPVICPNCGAVCNSKLFCPNCGKALNRENK